MKKLIDALYAGVFLLLLIVPLITMNTGKDVVSEIDNRQLKEMPAFGEKGFTSDFEAYVADRIGGRNLMIREYAALNDLAAHDLTHPTYTYGREGYIFFNMHGNITYNAFHKAFAEMAGKLQTYCEDRGARFYFLFDPEKISVYRRFLPEGVNYEDSWVGEMLAYMDELGVNYVDNTALLTEKSYSEAVFNQRYDAGHWNDLGSFYAANALLERIHRDIPAVEPLGTELFDISSRVARYLNNSEFVLNEEVPVFSLRSEYEDATDFWQDEIELDPRFPAFGCYINRAPGAEELPAWLVFQGSYFNRSPLAFVPASSRVVEVHNYQNVLSIDYYFNIFQPDIVILDAAEYVFSDQYFNASGMLEMDLNPAVPVEAAFEEHRLDWIYGHAGELPFSTAVRIKQGKAIDRIETEAVLSDARYVYLVSDGCVIDLRRDEYADYCAGCVHGSFTEGTPAVVLIETEGGELLYTPAVFKTIMNLLDDFTPSQGTVAEGSSITFTTRLSGNRFNQVAVQLLSGDEGEYLKTVGSTWKTGESKYQYTHEGETGWYLLRFKGNTNLRDEYADYRVYLEENAEYIISFTVETLTEKTIRIDRLVCAKA